MGLKRKANQTKAEFEKEREEYWELRNRLKMAQTYTPVKRQKKRVKGKNGKVTTYHISELEGDGVDETKTL